jgi:hypothetical protein
MNLLTAHAMLARREDRSIAPLTALVQGPDGPLDAWPAVCVALADLSGQLVDAKTEDDLVAAVRHGYSLLECDVLTKEAVKSLSLEVLGDLIRWGGNLERRAGAWAWN